MKSGATKIIPCSCTHKDQDAMYGKGNRVHNRAGGKGGESRKYTCTVCVKERTVGQ